MKSDLKPIFTRTKYGLYPASDSAIEALKNISIDEQVSVKISTISYKSRKRRRKYWGVLIPFVLDYWQSKPAILQDCEIKIIKEFCNHLGLNEIEAKGFLVEKVNQRAKAIDDAGLRYKASKECLHEWIKKKMGFYEITQEGQTFVRRTRSISFEKCSDEEFDQFYKKAVEICYSFVMSNIYENSQDFIIALDKFSELQ